MASEYVNRTQLAALFGVSMPTIDAWVREGMPVVKRGAKGVPSEYDSAACIEWRMQRELAKQKPPPEEDDIEAIERRKAIADATIAEVKAAKARELVADIATMERNLARAFAVVRSNLRNIPARAVSLLIGETNEARFKSVLLQEIDGALEALATADLTAEDEDEDGEE